MKTYSTLLIIILTNVNFSIAQCDHRCWDQVFLQGGQFNCLNEEIVFEDNFDSNTLDISKWQTHLYEEDYFWRRTNGDCGESFFFEDNVKVENGNCILQGKYEPETSFTVTKDGIDHEYTRNFTTGLIMSRYDKPAFYYGKYEARIKNSGNGWWPAFWLWAFDEIDIFENFSDDTRFLTNIYSGKDECSTFSKQHYLSTLKNEFNTYTVDWTPFKISFYVNNKFLDEIYRLYKDDGTPLIIDCQNQTIPEGKYFLNPNFVEPRRKGFRPILNNTVLPRHGHIENADGSCLCQSIDCNEPSCADWGHPIGPNCEIVGDINSDMLIDYVRVTTTHYETCGSILVHGESCKETGIVQSPKSCNKVCPFVESSLFVESYSEYTWSKETDINSVNSSQNIEILDFDNYEIKYKFLNQEDGIITINYLDNCNNNESYTINLQIEKEDFLDDLVIEEIDECINEISFFLNDSRLNCANNSIDQNQITWNVVAKDKWNIEHEILDFTFNNGLFTTSWPNKYFITNINVTGQLYTECYGNMTQTRNFEIPFCTDCCPEDFTYDGANCLTNLDFKGVNAFIYEDAFYTTQNCFLYSENNCCPPGTTNNGPHCYFKHIENGFEGFIHNNKFYTNLNCDINCCPDNFDHDGANCASNFYFSGVKGHIIDDGFYTTKNCTLYPNNECCPPGTTNNGEYCFYQNVESGYEGFIYNNSFYVVPNCDICCPEGATFDGANCYFALHFTNVTGGFEDGTFFTSPNCNEYPESNCCPPGSIWTPSEYRCKFIKTYDPTIHSPFIYNNSFYVSPLDCYPQDNQYFSPDENSISSRKSLTNNKVYPNPFTDELILDFSNEKEKIISVKILKIDGTLILNLSKDLNRINRISEITKSGIYLVTVVKKNSIETYKVICIN